MQTVIGNVRVIDLASWDEMFTQKIWPQLKRNGAKSARSYIDPQNKNEMSYLLEIDNMNNLCEFINTSEAWQLFVDCGAHPMEILSEARGAA